MARKPKKPSGHAVTFEFGETEACRAFLDRNPTFIARFDRLATLGNKCFSQRPQPNNRLEDICFGLGHTCREDFLEILFLSINGYGNAALKILRGLFERAVTLAFIIKHPEKADTFMNFTAIQEHRGLEATLKIVSEADFDKHMGSPQTVAEIRGRYKVARPNSQVTLCKTCKTTRTANSWDEKDLASMVHELGDPYKQLYLVGYALPNFSIHATLASAARYDNLDDAPDFIVLNAIWIFILAVSSQNTLFKLNLDSEIDVCWKETEDTYVRQDS